MKSGKQSTLQNNWFILKPFTGSRFNRGDLKV